MSKRRVHAEGTYAHYVTFTCYDRRTLLTPDICKRAIIGTLDKYLRDVNGICIGFVIMLDHVHALVWFPDEHRISQLMNKWKEMTSKQIKSIYASRFGKYWSTIDADDPVWIPRYYGFNIYSYKKLREKLDYMHNNPVRAGLVKDICDWPWSSARFWHLAKPVGIRLSFPP
jgi:putative transposase